MKPIIVYLLSFFYLEASAQSITSPQIRCVSVLPNGNISISWQTPADPAHEFFSYQIYISNTLGSPTYSAQPGITTYNTTNYTCTSIINAQSQPYFIYIQTVTTNSLTLPALDTVRTIFLSPLSNGSLAQLNWSNFANPMPPGEGSFFQIWREHPIGFWQPLSTVPVVAGVTNYHFTDTISICSDSINYRIELFDSLSHCTSVSNVKGAWLQDKNKPSVPQIDSVSVINGQVVMGISPSYSKDVKCYKIYNFSFIGNTYTLLDSICNYNQPALYTNTTLDPDTASVELSTLAQDSCARELSIFPDNPQNTIFTHATYDFCNKKSIINWTPYNNMVTGVGSYEIFCSVSGGPYHHLGDTTAIVYYQNNLQPGITYCYYVRAHSKGKTIAGKDTASSTSNIFCLTTANPPLPKMVYLYNVTVNPTQTIDVEWFVNQNDPIGGFNIYRSTSLNGTYTLVKNLPFTNVSNYSFTDEGVNTNLYEYFYYVVVLDNACLHPVLQSDTSNSILLKARPGPNLTANLNWNNYAKYAGNVSGYNIYRSVNGVFNGTPVAFVPFGSTVFVDDLSPYTNQEGMFIYYVEALEAGMDSYGFQEKSWSNYDTVYIDANLYIPNAFVTYGVNKVFLPIGAFVDNSDYDLSIYNRWGVKIYETTDPNKGWDGSGHQEGVYAYTIQYKTSEGEHRQRKGTVTLIR